MTEVPRLEMRGLKVSYGDAEALRGIDVVVSPGEVVALVGGNGAGKTTTLKAASGLAEVAKKVEGRVFLDGIDISRRPAHRRARDGIIHVPEGRRVFPDLTVDDNLRLGGWRWRRRRDVREAVAETYARFPLLGPLADRPAGLLSGGEQQVLAIARGLMADPHVLLLDEPSLGLAPTIVLAVYDEIGRLAADGLTILLVEQLASVALDVATRGYVLEAGVVVHDGPAAELAADPRLAAAYLGSDPEVP